MSTSFPADRTALVTGAASLRGIGRATARRLASHGWNIGIIDVDAEGAEALAQQLTADYGVRALGVGADVVEPASAAAAVDRIVGELPQIVALANIAGVSSPVPYLELDEREWRRIIDINVNGVHFVTLPVVRRMVENRIGRIVTISSVSAQRGGGTFGRTPYSASKAAVIGFTRSLARELGEFDITVNAVAPGPIDTDIMGGTLDDERRAGFIAAQMIRRMGTVDDVAHAIEFLLSEDSGFITGQTLSVNGGLHLQ